jgi:outer membrane protein TolC
MFEFSTGHSTGCHLAARVGRRGPMPLACLLASAALSLFAGKAAAQDSTQLDRLRTVLVARSLALAALRADTAAAAAQTDATGFAAPAALALEVEEVPDGVDVSEAGSIRLGVSRELLSGARRRARREVAQVEEEESRLALGAAERQVRASADHALLRAIGERLASRRLAAEDTLLTLAEDALRIRFEVGEARFVDVLRLRTERLRVQSALAGAAAASRVARLQVLAIGGHSLAVRPGAQDSLAALLDSVIARPDPRLFEEPLPPAPSVDSLIQSSPALHRSALAVRRAEAARSLAVVEQRPALSAGLGIQRFGEEAGGHAIGPTLELGLSLPFTSGRSNRLQREAADLAIAAAQAAHVATLGDTQGELIAARERYEGQRERLALYDRALLRGAREERESALVAYRSGDLSLLELLDFERALAQSELDLLRGRITASAALAELYGAVSPSAARHNALPGTEFTP